MQCHVFFCVWGFIRLGWMSWMRLISCQQDSEVEVSSMSAFAQKGSKPCSRERWSVLFFWLNIEVISACEKGGVWELAMWILYAMSKWQASSQQRDGGCLATDKKNSHQKLSICWQSSLQNFTSNKILYIIEYVIILQKNEQMQCHKTEPSMTRHIADPWAWWYHQPPGRPWHHQL